ncbi:MAG: ATP-binding protein [Cytophagales bacterium]|nr:ATP-binding protein [Armatimonadota bacterium]
MKTAAEVAETAVEATRERDSRIFLLAPTGRDAPLAAEALRAAGLTAIVCSSMEDLTRALTRGAGAVVIAQEALTPPELDSLSRTLQRQPPWSDLPVLVLTGSGRATEAGEAVLASLEQLGNATLLERPVRIATLVRAVRVALRTRHRQYEIREHLQERVAMLDQQRVFLRDVLASVTEGRLRLCDTLEDLPPRLPALAEPIPLSEAVLRRLRREVLHAAIQGGFHEERADDLVTSVNEAGMNAIVHGGGGTALIGGKRLPSTKAALETVQVWIEDQGSGIDMARLPRATLERGYSSAGTFGHGFWMMLKATDRTYLLTGPKGTTVVIEQDQTPPAPTWMRE